MTPNKEQVMLELLKDAWVYVQLDPRREGVELRAPELGRAHQGRERNEPAR